VSDDGLSETTNPVVVADDVPTATREFDSLLSCVQICATNAVSELTQMFQQFTLFLQDMDSSCFTSRIPVSRVSETKTVRDLIRLANLCNNEVMMVAELDLLEYNCLVYAVAKAAAYISKGNFATSAPRQNDQGG